MFSGFRRTAVNRAMAVVDREFFLSGDQRGRAHQDRALPIGWGQTISQPSLVAFMTEQLRVDSSCRVFEIGTGSGFQTAILAELADEVFAVERLPALAENARERLRQLGYRNISFRIDDGALGWPEHAPFGRIMVTAAARTLPPALAQQLACGGRLVAPLGPTPEEQILCVFEKNRDGTLRKRDLGKVRFVPLVTPTQQ